MSLDTNPVALRVNRRNMDAFIRADPVEISLTRTQKVKTAAGGYSDDTETPLDPQQFRLVPFKRRLYDYTQSTTEGHTQNEDYVLVGRHTVDILRDDTFEYNGDLYQVDSVEPKMDDRLRTDRVVAKISIQLADKAPPQ